MQDDFGDLRFTSDDGLTELEYWLEDWNTGVDAEIWVKVPTITGSAESTIYMYFDNDSVSSTSDPENTMLFFEDFLNSATNLVAFGSDTGWTSGFDPETRRIYFFGVGADSLESIYINQWVNIDTWEVGYVYIDSEIEIHGAGVIYDPEDKLFYIYGGTSGNTPLDTIYTFDPVSEVFTLLSETLPLPVFNPSPVIDPDSRNVYLFGGRKNYSGSDQFTNFISVHDIGSVTPAVTSTGAILPIASDGMSPVFSPIDEKIYLIGGAYNGDSPLSSLNTILAYDPSTPGVNPVAKTSVLPTGRDTAPTAYHDGNVYVFGGYSFGLGQYTDEVLKFNVVGDTIEVLPETLYKRDDDAFAFYDSVNDKIFVGPLNHSSASDNAEVEKAVVLEFDPDTETFDLEPSLSALPVGWDGSAHSSLVEIPRAVGGSFLALSDREEDKGIVILRSIPEMTGTTIIEYKINIPNDLQNPQFYVGDNVVAATGAVGLRTQFTEDWVVWSSEIEEIINPITQGYQILGTRIDEVNEKHVAQFNRVDRTASLDWWFPGQDLNQIRFSTSGSGRGSTLIDWVLTRNSTTGVEPVISIDVTQTLYSNTIQTLETSSSIEVGETMTRFVQDAVLNDGQITYILSNDGGATWQHYDGASWIVSNEMAAQSSSAEDVDTNIESFDVGEGDLSVKAFLGSADGRTAVSLVSLIIEYQTTAEEEVSSRKKSSKRRIPQSLSASNENVDVSVDNAEGSRQGLLDQLVILQERYAVLQREQQIYSGGSVGITCPHFTEYHPIGVTNDGVRKWQEFLNGELGLEIPLTGYYGFLTDSAVRKFQAKYDDKILEPWGIIEPTGKIYKTTRAYANYLIGCPEGSVSVEQNLVDFQSSF